MTNEQPTSKSDNGPCHYGQRQEEAAKRGPDATEELRQARAEYDALQNDFRRVWALKEVCLADLVAIAAERDRLSVEVVGLESKVRVAETIIKDMKADKARLDWLEANRDKVWLMGFEKPVQEWSISSEPTDSYSGAIVLGCGDTIRTTIDKAMKQEGKP